MSSQNRKRPLGSRLAADAVVLRADGRLRRASEVQVGDAVYGTLTGVRRHYALTVISAHRVTFDRGYRLVLADGTAVVVGADQAFLTYRGWKQVTGAQQGPKRRAHLTENSQLLGTGHFEAEPKKGADYKRGYLCGLIQGDGHVGSYLCTPVGKRPWIKHGFRLALADPEALDRARIYLAEAGLEVKQFVFQRAMPNRRVISAIGNQTRDGVDLVRRIIDWPSSPNEAWRTGFLAGIFDAEGSCDRGGAMRICNTDPAILEQTGASLRHFDFDVVRESTTGRKNLAYLRIRRGLRERLRFFHLTDPAITRKRSFTGRALYSDADLRVVAVQPLGRTVQFHELTTASGDLVVDGLIVTAGLTK